MTNSYKVVVTKKEWLITRNNKHKLILITSQQYK